MDRKKRVHWHESNDEMALVYEVNIQRCLWKKLKALKKNDRNYGRLSQYYLDEVRASLDREFMILCARYSRMNITNYHI